MGRKLYAFVGVSARSDNSRPDNGAERNEGSFRRPPLFIPLRKIP